MPNFDAWLSGGTIEPISIPQRAQIEWVRIQENPHTIALKRGTVVLPSQIVRLEYHDITRSASDTSGVSDANASQATVFGIWGHPTQPDTDIKTGDRFNWGGAGFKVTVIMRPPGEIQALCEMIS